jgi:hypothetical protein
VGGYSKQIKKHNINGHYDKKIVTFMLLLLVLPCDIYQWYEIADENKGYNMKNKSRIVLIAAALTKREGRKISGSPVRSKIGVNLLIV